MFPKELIFPDKYFSIVNIPKGKLNYKRKTNIRLRKSKKYNIPYN